MADWSLRSVKDIACFNPKERLAKGEIARKVPMEALTPWQRKISSTEVNAYNGGPRFRNGDTLVAKITPCLENGKTAFVDVLADNEVGFGSTEFIVLRAANNSCPTFVYYLARSPAFRSRAISCMEGTSGRKRVNENALKLVELPCPPLEHQKAIAAVLSALDAKIDLNNRINAELEALAKTIYDYWFVQFDFPDAHGRPYKSSGGAMVWNDTLKRSIPAGWETKALSDLVSVSTASINPASEPDKLFRHLSIPSFDESGSYATELGNTIGSNKFTVQGHDLLVSKLNPWFNRVVVDTDNEDMICSTEFVVWRCGDATRRAYLNAIATHSRFITHCTQSASSTSHSHRRVNPQVMMRYQVPYHKTTAEQFGKLVGPMIAQRIVNTRQNAELTRLRDWLLPLLMNGQVRVV